jgi:hypothetical protein
MLAASKLSLEAVIAASGALTPKTMMNWRLMIRLALLLGSGATRGRSIVDRLVQLEAILWWLCKPI